MPKSIKKHWRSSSEDGDQLLRRPNTKSSSRLYAPFVLSQRAIPTLQPFAVRSLSAHGSTLQPFAVRPLSTRDFALQPQENITEEHAALPSWRRRRSAQGRHQASGVEYSPNSLGTSVFRRELAVSKYASVLAVFSLSPTCKERRTRAEISQVTSAFFCCFAVLVVVLALTKLSLFDFRSPTRFLRCLRRCDSRPLGVEVGTLVLA